MDRYLAHYGIKRRSGRYPWGSGEEPKQRLRRDTPKYIPKHAKENGNKSDNSNNVNSIASIKDISTQSQNAVNSMERMNRAIKSFKQGKSSEEDLSAYSNVQLRQMIERLNLENQYYGAINNNSSIGKDRVNSVLEIVGGTLGVTGSALTIYMTAKKLME